MVWVKTLRIPVSLIAGLITAISFRISHWENISWLIATGVCAVAMGSMVQNDFEDREHDVKKGKYFAFEHPDQLRIFASIVWVVAMLIALMISAVDWHYGLVIWAMIASGLIYSKLRLIPVLPNLIVALTYASSTLFPIVAQNGSSRVWWLFVAVALTTFVREVNKDIQDRMYDGGYKWSFPHFVNDILLDRLIAIVLIAVIAIISLVFHCYVAAFFLLIEACQLLIRPGIGASNASVDLAMLSFVIQMCFARIGPS